MRLSKAGWRNVPVVSGRAATKQDVKDGVATFYIQDGRGACLDMNLPCLAEQLLEDGSVVEVIVVQAEYGPNSEVICGCKDFDGGEHVCTLPELKIIEENKQQRTWRFWSKK